MASELSDKVETIGDVQKNYPLLYGFADYSVRGIDLVLDGVRYFGKKVADWLEENNRL